MDVHPDLPITASDILLEDGNIKRLGTYTARLQFTKEIFSEFTVQVNSSNDDTVDETLLEEALAEHDEDPKLTTEETNDENDAESEVIEQPTNETSEQESDAVSEEETTDTEDS